MPGRDIPLVSSEIYHIVNRGVGNQIVFANKKDYARFLDLMTYYQNENIPLRYSKFLTLAVKERERIWENRQNKKSLLVEIIAYCLMPNHFHLLLKQLADNGISKFIGNLTNSYTRYFNTRTKRFGPLFQGKFKAVRIESEEQLLHVTRYIHLNPYTSYLIKNLEDLLKYPYSSFLEYLELSKKEKVEKSLIRSYFKNLNSFREFTFNQADYQRKLQEIKYLILEK